MLKNFVVSPIYAGVLGNPHSQVVVPPIPIIEAIVLDASNADRVWARDYLAPNSIYVWEKVYLYNSHYYEELSKQQIAEATILEDWLSAFPGINPDPQGNLVLRLHSMDQLNENRVKVLVEWAFSKRACGGHTLKLAKTEGNWKVVGAEFASIC